MKKIIALITIAAMLLSICCGCGAQKEKDLLAQIKDKGTITIAMEGNWAPWTYEDENGNLVGFEVEVSGAVAEMRMNAGTGIVARSVCRVIAEEKTVADQVLMICACFITQRRVQAPKAGRRRPIANERAMRDDAALNGPESDAGRSLVEAEDKI